VCFCLCHIELKVRRLGLRGLDYITEKFQLNLGSRPHVNPNIDIFVRFFDTERRGIFPQFGIRWLLHLKCDLKQWRRQDLLRGGAKIKIMSRGTHGGLRGRVQQLLDD